MGEHTTIWVKDPPVAVTVDLKLAFSLPINLAGPKTPDSGASGLDLTCHAQGLLLRWILSSKGHWFGECWLNLSSPDGSTQLSTAHLVPAAALTLAKPSHNPIPKLPDAE